MGGLERALGYYEHALFEVEKHFGRNQGYGLLCGNCPLVCRELGKVRRRRRTNTKDSGRDTAMKGIELCRAYFEAEGMPMLKRLEKQYPELRGKLAAGLVGQGSECLGFDNAVSQDHDFGAAFALWLPQELYERYGSVCQEAYDRLPSIFRGMPKRQESPNGSGRVGVLSVTGFFYGLMGKRSIRKAAWNGCFCRKAGCPWRQRGSVLG